MPDDDPVDSPIETEVPDDAEETPPLRKQAAVRKKRVVKKKAKATKPARRRATSRRSAGITTSVKVQVGDDAVFIPKALAANLTSKDLKKLRAVFKRIRKRGKRRAAKKGDSRKK